MIRGRLSRAPCGHIRVAARPPTTITFAAVDARPRSAMNRSSAIALLCVVCSRVFLSPVAGDHFRPILRRQFTPNYCDDQVRSLRVVRRGQNVVSLAVHCSSCRFVQCAQSRPRAHLHVGAELHSQRRPVSRLLCVGTFPGRLLSRLRRATRPPPHHNDHHYATTCAKFVAHHDHLTARTSHALLARCARPSVWSIKPRVRTARSRCRRPEVIIAQTLAVVGGSHATGRS